MPSNVSFDVYFRKALSKQLYLVTELGHAGSRIYKISSTVSKVIGDGVRGGHSNSAFYSVKLCVMVNFSLHHNVLA